MCRPICGLVNPAFYTHRIRIHKIKITAGCWIHSHQSVLYMDSSSWVCWRALTLGDKQEKTGSMWYSGRLLKTASQTVDSSHWLSWLGWHTTVVSKSICLVDLSDNDFPGRVSPKNDFRYTSETVTSLMIYIKIESALGITKWILHFYRTNF